jgi:SacI restriction endonuclease
LVAAAFDVVFDEVRMGRVNDPSRRFPGDVQVLGGAQVVLAAEARQKLVYPDDVAAFARAAGEAGVANAVMVALHPDQEELDRDRLSRLCEERYGVLMSVIDSVDEFLRQGLMWSGARIDAVLSEFPDLYGQRLEEIEVGQGTVARWRAVLSERAD